MGQLRARRLMSLVFALGVVLLAPVEVMAHDGDITLWGSSTDFSQVYVDGTGKVHVDINRVGDCPTGVSSCTLQVRWSRQCEWLWCLGYDDQSGWVGVTGSAATWCSSEKSRWKLDYRWVWSSVASTTMEYHGQYEYTIDANGTAVYRLYAAGGFNVTTNAGESAGVTMSTQYGLLSGASPATNVSSSGGQYLYPTC